MLSGGADNAGRMYDLATGQTSQFAAHDGPIRSVKWIDNPGQPMVATGSWDKVSLGPFGLSMLSTCCADRKSSPHQTLKYWNMTAPTPVATVPLPERCYCKLSHSGRSALCR